MNQMATPFHQALPAPAPSPHIRFPRLSLSWDQLVLGSATLLISLGMTLRGAEFAKSGIPVQLGTRFGALGQQAPKIFVFETYIALVGLLCLWNGRRSLRRAKELWRDPLTKLLVVLFGTGMARLLVDLTLNPLLGIRNSAFVWYLSVPFLLAVFGLSVAAIEWTSLIVTGFVSARFLLTYYYTVLHHEMWLDWSPYAAFFLVYFFALTTSRKHWGQAIVAFLGIPLGFCLWSKFQRTFLVGLAASLSLIWITYPSLRRTVLKRLAVFSLAFVVGAASWTIHLDGSLSDRLDNLAPFMKAQADEQGIEIFRGSMWKDALGLFAQNPWFGIGFQSQVVTRVFLGGDKYAPNTGGYEKVGSPPISGPHNSYLNALTRMGVLGALFLLTHLIAARRLWRRGLYATFFLLLSQIVYAFFNVGLEGPSRSVLLLTALGAALLVGRTANRESPAL